MRACKHATSAATCEISIVVSRKATPFMACILHRPGGNMNHIAVCATMDEAFCNRNIRPTLVSEILGQHQAS